MSTSLEHPQIALGDELLQPRVLRPKRFQATDVIRLQRAELLLPYVDALLADAVPLGDGCDRFAIRFAQDCQPSSRPKISTCACFPPIRRTVSQVSLGPKLAEQVKLAMHRN